MSSDIQIQGYRSKSRQKQALEAADITPRVTRDNGCIRSVLRSVPTAYARPLHGTSSGYIAAAGGDKGHLHARCS